MNEKHDFYCVLPWNHRFIDNSGKEKLCCLSQHHEWTQTLKDQIKKDFANHQQPESCKACHKSEYATQESFRKHVNRLFPETLHKIKENQATDIVEFLDLRFGNVCNLKCRMCDPDSSLGLSREFNQYYSGQKIFSDKLQLASLLEMTAQTDWSRLKRINFAGGEPFLSEEIKILIGRLIQAGHHSHIDLTINTNGTVLDHDLLSQMKRFRSLKITISLDGLAKMNSYIRYPSKWSDILGLVDYLGAADIQTAFNFTMQIYNVLEWPEFLQEFKYNRQHQVYLNLLHDPVALSLQTLPPSFKEFIKKEYEKTWSLSSHLKNELESVIRFMFQNDTSQNYSEFVKWTQFLDTSRAQSWSVLNPFAHLNPDC